ncbi:MAG: T9SS type A sorting domain-containing protein [Bacteroidetes bacterium]|nr:T9SS type A sorting domain-containing protein [Bacteroidota bacterium]
MSKLLPLVLVSCFASHAQTTFWTETFGTGCNQLQLANGLNAGGNGPWNVSILGPEDPQANVWYISAEENGNAIGACGTGCGSNRTLHVGSIPNGSGLSLCPTGDCGASYDAGGTSSFGGTSTGTNKRAESPTINCTGHSNITLAFRFMENGDGTNDNATLWYYNGVAWSQINPLFKTPLCSSGQGKWASFSMTLPASANNNPGIKLGFLWVNNDDGVGTDPSIAVDDITLTDPAVLPISILSFTAAPQENNVGIDWVTSTEINNNFFTVERSKDGVVFEFVTQIKGAGNSTQIKKYMVTDSTPYQGFSYYRLKQTDYNGKSEAFNIVSVNINSDNKNLFNVFPNPNNGVFTVQYAGGGNTVSIQIYNTLGSLLMEKEDVITNNNYSTLLNTLDAGVYVLRCSVDGGNPQVVRLIVQK